MAAYYAQGVHFSSKLSALQFGGCLVQQYIVNVATKTKKNILKLLVLNQAQLCAELYQRLTYMVEHDVSELFCELHFSILHVSWCKWIKMR